MGDVAKELQLDEQTNGFKMANIKYIVQFHDWNKVKKASVETAGDSRFELVVLMMMIHLRH
jgi:hypothetical protein